MNSGETTTGGQDNFPSQQVQTGVKQKNGLNTQEGSFVNPTEQNPQHGVFFAANPPAGQMLHQPLPIPQAMPNQPPQTSWQQPVTGPYTAAMQLERQQQQAQLAQVQALGNQVNPNNRVPFTNVGDMSQTTTPASYSSPSRGSAPTNPTLQDLSNYNAAGGVPHSAAQPPRSFYEMQQQQMQAQQQQHAQAFRGNFGFYPHQMQYGMHPSYPGGMPQPDPNQQFQQPQYPMFQPPNMPYPGFNPYQPMYGGGIEPWQKADGDNAFAIPMAQHPQHSSAHGNAESFRYIRQINNNDVLCGRGGATNSHIGNRAFRQLVKQFKDKYLRAKKKEKPSVAGEIVDKIRSLDPPGRFLKKDRDTGYWLDIGDIRAKEKTSQALREGAPLIRRQMRELHDDQGGMTDNTVNLDKPLTVGSLEESKNEVGEKRKTTSPVPQLPVVNMKKENDKEDDSSSPPISKKFKAEKADESKPSQNNDDDNASNPMVSVAASDGKEQVGDSKVDTDSKGKDTVKINETHTTEDETEVLIQEFDPPRGLNQETNVKTVEEVDDEGDGKVLSV